VCVHSELRPFSLPGIFTNIKPILAIRSKRLNSSVLHSEASLFFDELAVLLVK